VADLNVAVAIIGEDKLSGPARAAARSLQEVESSAKSADSAVAGFGRTAAGIAAGGARLAGMVGVFQAIQSAFSAAGEAMVGFNARLEQTQVGFATLLKSGEDAEVFLFDLQQLAATTPFEFEDVAVGARNLLAMGFAAKDVKPTLIDLGNVAAGLGQSSEGFAAMARVLGQMQATGRVLAGDLLQLSQAGFPVARVFEVMAQQTGKTTAELRKMQEQGQLSTDVFMRAFQTIARTDFAGAMEAQSKTFSGAMSTIRDSLTQVAAFAFRPLFERLSELAQRIAAFVSSDQFMSWAANVAAAVDVALDAIGTLADGFVSGLSAVLDTVLDLGRLIYEALSWINPFASHSPSLVDQVADGVAEINSSFRDLAQSKAPIDTTAMSLDQLKDALADAKDEARDYADAVKDAERAIQDLARSQLEGEGAFSDRSFQFDQAIARMQLQINRARLSNAPKGSIDALEKSLARLRLQADNVRLEERLKFDPLHRAIDKLANPRTEKSFGDVVRGIKEQQQALTTLRPAAEAAAAREKQLADAVKDAADAAKAAKAAGVGGLAAGPRGDPLAGFKESIADAKAKWDAFKADFDKARADWANLGPIRRAFDEAFGAGAFDQYRANLAQFATDVRTALASIKDVFTADGLAGVLGAAGDAVTKWMIAQWQAVDWKAVWKSVTEHATTLAENLGSVAESLQIFLTHSAGDVDWERVWGDSETGKRAAEALVTHFGAAPRAEAARGLGAWLGGVTDDAVGLLEQALGSTGDPIVQRLGNALLKLFRGAHELAGGPIQVVARRFITDNVDDFVGGYVRALTSGPNITRIANGFVDLIRRALADALESARALVENTIENLQGKISDATGLPAPRTRAPPQYIPPSARGPQTGFQHGGYFRVGGQGGPDSQMVAFRATPGEVVAVGNPQRGGGYGPVNIAINLGGVTVSGSGDEQRLAARIRDELEDFFTDGLRSARGAGVRFPLGVRAGAV